MAEVGADLELARRGADRRRLQHHCAALLELALQLEVLLLMRGRAGHLQRRVEERGELLLLRRHAVDSSKLWACLLRTSRQPTPPTSGGTNGAARRLA